MQKIAIIQISEEGKDIARLILSQVYAQKHEGEIISRVNVGKRWKDFDALRPCRGVYRQFRASCHFRA